jgi:hypothetical protein
MQMTPRQLAAFGEMKSTKVLNLVIGRDEDLFAYADAISQVFPNAVHVGIGGRVSTGRLADVCPDEVFDLEMPQTIIIEIYPDYSPSVMVQYLQFVLDTKLPVGTTVLFLSKIRPPTNGAVYGRFESRHVIPMPIANHMVNFEFKL